MRWVTLAALSLLVGALVWLGVRDDAAREREDAAERSSVAARASAPTHRARRPPPRRSGLLDAPEGSVVEDAQAKTGALAGTVRSWLDASPVAGAELTFMGAGSIDSVITDADGRFVFVAAQPGPYTLASVLADDYLPYAPELGLAPLRYVARPDRRVEGVTIELVPVIELLGQVLDSRGAAVPGAAIRWLGIGTGETALAADDALFTSDARGEFRFTARHDAWLEARHEAHGVGRARVDERALAVGRLVLHLEPEASLAHATIAGRVIDPAGEPVHGARVLALPGDDDPSAEAVTDEDGAFTLADLVPGRYRVEARAPPLAPVWATGVPTGSAAVQLQLAPGGTLTGTITAEDGSVVPGATVAALRHTGPLTRAAQAQTTVFDAQGEFRLEGLPPGIYDVVGGAADHALTRVRDVELGTAEVVVALVLPEGGRISGRVLDASTGEPLALARVEVERSLAAGASIAPLRSSALTDDAGAFEIDGVEPGRCSVYAYALDYAPRAISGLEVEAGADAGPVEVALHPAADAAGEVFDIVGIGVMVQVNGETLRVGAVIEDGGADRAGIVAGDLLLEIDGIPVVGLVDFGGAVQALRGREGTEVRLGVAREGVEPFEVTAVRARVRG